MNITDKTLLILGILRSHQSHGYELNSFLGSAMAPLPIGKANAYQILKRCEEKGWITASDEREGNRPPRRVFTITSAGEDEFQTQLRQRLSTHVPAVQPDTVSLNFVSLLPDDEAVQQLAQRLEEVELRLRQFQEETQDGVGLHYGVDYMLQHAEFERDWLRSLLDKLKSAE